MATATNARQVIGDLEKWAEATGQDLGQAVASAALDVIRLTIKRTPVDEGRLRGNWQTTINRPAMGEIDRIDKSGNKVLAEAARVARSFKEGSIWFVNNTSYSTVVEFGLYPSTETEKTSGGFSKLAPRGMLRVSVAEFDAAIRKAIREANQSRQ